jgi:hypothetical protein
VLATLAIALLLSQAEATSTSEDLPFDSRLTPEEKVIPGTVAPAPLEVQRIEPLSIDRRAARFFGALGMATLLGDLGAGGVAFATFGTASLSSSGFGGYSSFYLVIAGFPASASLIPLLAGVAPLPLYSGADGRHLGFGIFGAMLGTLVGAALVGFGYLFGSYLPGLAPFAIALGLVMPGLGSAIAYEVSVPDDAPEVPPSAALRFVSGALASTGFGFALGGTLGAVSAIFQLRPPLGFFIGAYAAPLGFGLGPLIYHPKKSAPAYFAAVGGAAVASAAVVFAWAGLDAAVAWVGYSFNPLFGILLGVARALSAFLPGIVASGLYSAVADRDEAAPRERSDRGVQVLPSVAFDGKRGMLGVTLVLP